MTEPLVEHAPRGRFTWREVCGGIAWVGMALAVMAFVSVIVRVFGASVGLALAGGGMAADDAAAVMRDATFIAWGTGAIVVLAVVGRRWVLSALALVLLGVVMVLLGGSITSN